MSTLAVKIEPLATEVYFKDQAIHVLLADGREVSAPLEWFPALRSANESQKKNWRLIGDGVGIHWEDIDEDIETESLLAIQ
jgi:hypothetical protein